MISVDVFSHVLTYSVQEPYVKIPEHTIREALRVVLGITNPLELKASFLFLILGHALFVLRFAYRLACLCICQM